MKAENVPNLILFAGGIAILFCGLATLCFLAWACHMTGEWWAQGLEIVLLVGAWYSAGWVINAVKFTIDFVRAE